MNLLVGDTVVYASYGIGRIVAREQRTVLGQAQDVLVLELSAGLSVTLPVARAHDVIRAPLGESGLVDVERTLRDEQVSSDDGWLKRRRATTEKLTAGDPVGLAEVVRDGARRRETLMLKKQPGQLAAGEKDIYLRARELLAAEIALLRGLEAADADAWIEERLKTAT